VALGWSKALTFEGVPKRDTPLKKKEVSERVKKKVV